MIDDSSTFRPNPPAGTHVATLLVSVFLLLLSFFIALVANSQLDAKRSKHVMQSVSETFASDQASTGKGQNALPEITVDKILKDIKTSTASVIPLQEMQVQTHGDLLVMKMSSNYLFLRGSAQLREDRRELYANLSEIISRWEDTARVSVTLVQGIHRDDADEARLAMTRAGNFARFLENRGVPPQHLSVAISERDADSLALIFHVIPTAQTANKGGKE